MKTPVLIITFLLSLLTSIWGRDSIYFQSPVRHNIVLAGSFGELRSSHFHAGVDIKPANKVVGDTLMAAATGFVSRIKIQTGGYGQAIYIDHPNGYTTVYAHLLKLPDSLQAYVEQMQRAAHSYSVDLYPDHSRFEFNQGEYIGLMGNTGRSYAPHLHFEIRHTQSEVPEDPGLWGISASDSKAPTIQSYSVEGLTPEFRRTWEKIFYPTAKNYQGQHVIPAWRVGINVQAYDQMDGSTNRNGIYHRQLFVDGALHWESKVDAVGWDETKYINAYIDYYDKQDLNRTAVCGYVLPGNELSIINDTLDNLPIALYQDKPRKIEIVTRDLAGNERIISFDLFRAAEIPAPEFAPYNLKIKWDSTYQFKAGSSRFKIKEKTFVKDVYFSYHEEVNDELTEYKIHDKRERIFKPIASKIRIPKYDSSHHHQYCLVYKDEKRLTTFGGSVEDQHLLSSISRLGDFTIAVDTVAPSISPVSFSKNVLSKTEFTFRVDDDLACMGEADDVNIEVYIDDEWQITPYKIMTRILQVPFFHLNEGEHDLLIKVRDDRGNVGIWQSSFTL